MSKPSNLSTVLHDLKSEKVKERQQGLASLRTVFERDTVVLTLDETGKGQAWLSVFQALYATVGIERAASFKKGSQTAAIRRLSDAAATVRWLTERSVQRMNKAVAKSLFTHLTQTMVHNGELLAPVALDYIKALKCLVSWAPHLDHLNEDIWERIVEMAFNVILGDPVRQALDEEEEPDDMREPTADPDSSEFFLDDDPDDLPSTSTALNPRKRRQRDFSAAHSSSRPKVRSKTPRSVSLEQIEFTSLLVILMQSPSAPLLSPKSPYLAAAVLRRLYRFLERYPADTSLHHDYILCLSATLSHLALNHKSEVERFGREAWDSLLDLWKTKNKTIKEGLVSILRVLFPYLTSDQDSASIGHQWVDGVQRLWYLLDSEAGSRWGVDGLSLDALRLDIVTNRDEANALPAFVAHTYRAGWHFDSEQALAWAVLELQADCAEKLFQLSESVHTSPSKVEGKRAKLENPITSLLHSIQTHPSPAIRAYHLQILLFFIDRHWSILHDSLQRDVINLLLQYVSFDDTTIQSWTFLCFSAIAHADTSSLPLDSLSQHPNSNRPRDAAIWDPIWTHAIRRANVPGVCRAACHAACVLLSNAKRLLTTQRILVEIETLAKDLDVQGPAFPFDSVCVFLAQCLRVASQDVRLHRMQIEEKVLSWLLDNWGVSDGSISNGSRSGQTRMPLFMIDDLLMLLQSICSFAKQVNLLFRVMLPDCPIMETMVEQSKTKVIRDFLLNGHLPPFRSPSETGKSVATMVTTNDSFSSQLLSPVFNGNLAQPRGRERRISTYLLKSLESLASEFESIRNANGHPTAEKARQALDLAVVALLFESLLMLNGTRSTKRVVQAACKMVALLIALPLDHRWSSEERAFVLLGLEPLISQETEDDAGWEAITPPDSGTGIKTKVLQSLVLTGESQRSQTRTLRRNLQRMVVQSAEVQDTFSKVMADLRDVLRMVVGQKDDDPRASRSMNDGDDKDGFGPIRVMQQSPETRRETQDRITHRYIVEVCVSFLAVVPILQSTSGESTRDKDLIDLVLQSDRGFHLIAPVLFKNIKQRLLNLGATNLDRLLNKLGDLLKQYHYSRSENLQLLVTQLLDSTLHIWLQDPMANSEIVDKIRTLCYWISSLLKENKIRSWKLRDNFIRFFDRYIHIEPSQAIWVQDATDVENLPANILPLLGADRDIRVRFRVAVVNARLFSVARIVGQDALILYDIIKRSLTVDLNSYEHMLTRILSLGNIMVASAAVRRGPYWHMLEICLHSQLYHRHIEAVLRGVSARLGLTSFSMLFEAYASQIAYSIRQAQSDFLRFPPHLLGYRDRKDCAEAAFRGFTPSNVLAAGTSVSDVPHGRRLFMNHCKVIQKSPVEGLRTCFGEIIGYQITAWIDDNLPTKDLDELMKVKIMNVEGLGDFDYLLRQHVDGIVIAILRTLQDQDFSQEGTIVQALQAFGKSGKVIQTFQALSRYRRIDDFETYPPNLPNYGTETVLQSLAWFNARVPDTNSKATSYHILHELFAEVQHSPFVNEQVRLLNAISLWVAVHHDDFKELTLLHTLIRGAASVLAQSDLARAAQSVLEWAFTCYRRLGEKDPSFPDILIRIACLAHDYALDAENVAVKSMGNELVRWIDNQTVGLCKSTTLREQVMKALPAWPYQPSIELTQIFEDIASRSLSELLRDPSISSNKFRISRRLCEFALGKLYDEDDFATTDFWRLRDCIPSAEQLQDDDINAFASLLVMNKGRIHSFWSDHPPTQSVRAQHIVGSNKRRSSKPGMIVPPPQRAIVVSLLAMLDGNTPAQVHVAYNTLRSLMSVLAHPVPDIPHWHSWPTERRSELDYLQTYTRTPGIAQSRDMSELTTSESFHAASKSFPEWIAMITTLLSDILAKNDAFYAQLTPILQSDVSFGEQVLPVLVHTVLQADADIPNNKSTAAGVSYRRLLSNYFSSLLISHTVNNSCIRAIVDIILHLRHFRSPNNGDALAHDKWLDVDYTLLARNAITCGAYTTALLFLELAAEYREPSVPDDIVAEQIMFEIYSHIDEPDGFYGIKTKDLGQFLIKRFHHEKQWEKAFRFHGAALEAGTGGFAEAEGLTQAFHAFGFDRLAIETLQNPNFETGPDSRVTSMSYRSGWRTETWDLPDQTKLSNPDANLYVALRAIHRERDSHTIDSIIRRALREEMGRLKVLGAENLAEIREVNRNLMCISQVTQWRSPSIQNRLKLKQVNLSEWENFIQMEPGFEFTDLENVMATRISLVRAARQQEERDQIGDLVSPFTRFLKDVEKKCLVRLSEAARGSDQVQIALNSIIRSQKLEASPTFDVSQEFASVLWLQREQKLAVQFLKELLNPDVQFVDRDEIDPMKTAQLLAQLGTWTAEACLEKPIDILTNFFEPATTLADSRQVNDPSRATVYHQFAIFAEHQYHATRKSSDAIRWKLYVERKVQEIKQVQALIKHAAKESEKQSLTQDLKKAQALLQEDQELFQRHKGAREAFLSQAIDMYARCLEASDAFDDDGPIRLCSLWFSNFDVVDLQDKVQVALNRVQSRKFVFLAHQLAARLSKPNVEEITSGQGNLQQLMIRMCGEHPFHSLYQVYCLLPGRSSATVSRQSSRESLACQPEREAAASDIFNKLRGDSIKSDRIRDLERLCDASLQWAKHPIRQSLKGKKGTFRIPDDMLIRKLKRLKVPVATAHTPLDYTLRYDRCAWVESYDPEFTTAGGVNLPKINVCHGSDGVKYRQLFKGEGGDDPRQDAVMEQVFELVNIILRRDRETRRRNLHVRGYKVIPLDSQAGVLEFVGNTNPLRSWLNNAHTRYRSNDIHPNEAQEKLKSLQNAGVQALLAAYESIRAKLKPVMRHYFTERHKNPISWFAMRLNYTRSVATTSIVGHILGLGDRHSSNILMDNVTGDVIHIDLGIAFDQGKYLPVPERVPFRMTPDMVDGMGISGTQGVFQRCAEETLRVLREGSEVIMTVLEVFKHDPLHSWTASELKLKRVQDTPPDSTFQPTPHHGIGLDMSSGSAHEAADRALSSVTRKLDKALSVEYTVNELIAEATDVLNLATIFSGWGPHL